MSVTCPPDPVALAPLVACAACPLRALPAFIRFDSERVAFIQSLKVGELAVPARSSILREGDTPERLYTLLSGWAFRFKTLADGRRQILNVLLPGDLVGLQAKLFDDAAHGIEALTDARLCMFARDRMWDIFRLQPSLGFDLTWLGAREEAFVDEALLSAGRRSALERLAGLMMHLFRRGLALGLGDADAMPMPLTQALIADTLGLSAVHTNRTVREARARRLFVLAGGMLRGVDVAALARIAGSTEPALDPRPLF